MKANIILWVAGIFLLTLPLAQGQSSYKLSKSSMTVSGSSNLHDWTSTVNDLKGQGTFVLTDNALTGINSLEISVPVTSIKSSKGSIMDGKTHGALKYKEYSLISYQLVRVDGIEKTATGYRVKTTGNLTIAGAKRSITMSVDGKLMSDGSLNFKGSKALKMTDFNVSPPTAMMGALTTGDDVTVNFDITLMK
ncbi:MAG: YceI family protein [Saprospirales bacterium]|nr:YceI family protein [Saprospirales bacterium]MBK8492515.1 YceI family protein [Saprospirales bacterium]